ncbi:MAG TPA: bifunctional nuclease family protein [Gemmatimonadaceae bacterium]|nr:bifunctional nuclease family protein [Gemmatimonadaceae bacterium]
MIEVAVSRLGMDPGTHNYVIVLQEKDGQRLLPIWIGQPEAESIVMHMHNMKRARPLTHDLCKSIVVGLGAVLRRVQITRVENNTYYGELHLERDGSVIRIDSRPSDAIAIALRLEAPIFAAEALLVTAEDEDEDEQEAGGGAFTPPPAGLDPQELNAEELKRYLEHLRPEDFGKFNP